MDKEQGMILAKLRFDRAKELLEESKELLEKGSFKSANNRAFYAIEKSIKALLATELIEVMTHNGALKQFNITFIYKGDGTFTPEDYQKVARAEQIRNTYQRQKYWFGRKLFGPLQAGRISRRFLYVD